MITAGNYFNVTVDMTHVPNFPGDLASYCSTDHDSTGQDGIYMSYRKNGAWVNYDDGVLAGDFDYLVSKPTVNPIYRDVTEGAQCETPFIRWVEDQFVLTYQMESVGNNQSTLRALGTDGVNFTRDRVVLDFVAGESTGDGHTGYLRWGLNKFPDVPYKYCGYALHGGQGAGFLQLCGCDDPRVDDWQTINVMQKQKGEVFYGTDLTSGSVIVHSYMNDLDSVHQVGKYWFILCAIGTSSAGAGFAQKSTYWLPLADDGFTIMGEPIAAVEKDPASDYDSGGVMVGTTVGGEWYYDCATTGNFRQTAMATIDKLSGELHRAIQPTLQPALNASVTTYDLQSSTGMTELIESASTLTRDSAGLNIQAPFEDGACLFADQGFIPDNVEYVEWWVEGIHATESPSTGSISIGAANSKATIPNQDDSFRITSGEISDSGSVKFVQRLDSVDVSDNSTSAIWGFGFWTSYAAQAPKAHGFRWYPDLDKFYLIGESAMTHTEFTLNTGFDKTKAFYPFLALRGLKDGYISEHQFKCCTFKIKLK